MDPNAILSKLSQRSPATVLEKSRLGRGGPILLWVESRSLVEFGHALSRDPEVELDFLENLSIAQVGEAFAVTYLLRSHSIPGNGLALRCTAMPEAAGAMLALPSVRDVWPMAAAMEDELAELFGIRFLSADGAEAVNRPVGLVAWTDEEASSRVFPMRKKGPDSR